MRGRGSVLDDTRKENDMSGKTEQEIRRFIVEEVLEEREDEGLPEDIPLLTGLLDSFALMALIAFLEERFSVVVRNDQVVKQNFASVSSLAAFVEQRQQQELPSAAEA
jgi:acyl carrier protein